MQAGNLAAACGFHDRSLELREALVVANPTNVPDALDVVFSHAGLVQLALLEATQNRAVSIFKQR